MGLCNFGSGSVHLLFGYYRFSGICIWVELVRGDITQLGEQFVIGTTF